MSLVALALILLALFTFVAGQIFLKHAMESTTQTEFQRSSVAIRLGAGIILMTISFFITLGLLQRFDLIYPYPFQGLSIIIISIHYKRPYGRLFGVYVRIIVIRPSWLRREILLPHNSRCRSSSSNRR